MGEISAKILVAIATKMLTERFVSKMIVYSLRSLARNTANEIDDKVVAAVAEALDVP